VDGKNECLNKSIRMKAFLSVIVLAALNSIVSCASDVEWVNSKYHDTGSHWGVFAGILIFMVVFQSMGLGVEVWYQKSLSKFLEAQNLGDGDLQIR